MSELVEVQTSELIGPALDWAVDAIESGKPLEIRYHKNGSGEWIFVADGVPYPAGPRKFSTDWSQGGPLVERERIDVFSISNGNGWCAQSDVRVFNGYGSTPLIAAMRCLVASKRGDTVQVPKELLK